MYVRRTVIPHYSSLFKQNLGRKLRIGFIQGDIKDVLKKKPIRGAIFEGYLNIGSTVLFSIVSALVLMKLFFFLS